MSQWHNGQEVDGIYRLVVQAVGFLTQTRLQSERQIRLAGENHRFGDRVVALSDSQLDLRILTAK